MPAYETTPCCNAEYPWQVVETTKGMRGTRYYWVAHHDPIEAIRYGAGLPAMDEAWDASNAPTLAVTSRNPVYKGGVTQAAPARTGWTMVKVEYETPGGSGTLPPPLAGTKWTEINISGRTEQIYFGLQPASSGPKAPINNGDGYPKEVGTVELKICKYYNKNSPPDWARLNTLSRDRAVNSDAVTAPSLYKLPGAGFALAIGTAQFMGYEAQMVSDVLLVSITINVGVSKDLTWAVKDDKGNDSGSTHVDQIYQAAVFAGLW